MIDDVNIPIPPSTPASSGNGDEAAHGQTDAPPPLAASEPAPAAQEPPAAEPMALPEPPLTVNIPLATEPGSDVSQEPLVEAAGLPELPQALPPEERVGSRSAPAESAPLAEESTKPTAAVTGAPEGGAEAPREQASESAPQELAGASATSPAGASPAELSPEPARPELEPAPAQAAKPSAEEAPKSEKMDWYILKVQSNREESIRDGLRKRVSIAGLDSYFGDIIIPTEKVTEFKAGKRKVFKRKLYPGYLVVQMEINEDTWFLVRETPGIGDFTGAAGHPTPMLAREVASILAKQEEKADEAPKLKINFNVGDHVKIKEGTFENFEGEVDGIDETNGRVKVLINIFGRSTPVEIEYWQIESV